MDLVIVSGLSGSGKSSCLKILEDIGYHCIDNMPLELLTSLVKSLNRYKKIAIGIDIRTLLFDKREPNLNNLFKIIDTVKNQYKVKIKYLFITANSDIIYKRFNTTKRTHPLISLKKNISSVYEAIQIEQELIEPFASLANIFIDSSKMSPYDLQKYIVNQLNHVKDTNVFIQSFGFKNGIPINSDYIFDVRFIPNPYWVDNLREFSGKDSQVQDFLKKEEITEPTINNILNFIKFIYVQNNTINKPYVNISIGCTGGQHRSVYCAEVINNRLIEENIVSKILHRDLLK